MAIDMHTHLGLPISGPASDVNIVVEMLKKNSIDGALVMPRAGLRSNCIDHSEDNNHVLNFCKKAPDYLYPSFSINPLFGQKALDEIKRCKEEIEVNVLKLHPWLQGFSITSSEMDAVAAICQELGVVIIFHDGSPPYCTPMQIARLARDFPGLKVISGHAGLNDLWFDSLLAVKRYPNYYICLCGAASSQMQRIVDEVDPNQICVGSDMFEEFEDILWYRWESFRKLKMSNTTRKIIENETPKKLLGI